MAVIYETTVTRLGPEVDAFISVNILLMFASNAAPEELVDYSIVHEGNHLLGEIRAGQTLRIGDAEFEITAVGEAVTKNVTALGHFTLKADGSAEPEAPGTLNLENKELPTVQVGDTIRITD